MRAYISLSAINYVLEVIVDLRKSVSQGYSNFFFLFFSCSVFIALDGSNSFTPGFLVEVSKHTVLGTLLSCVCVPIFAVSPCYSFPKYFLVHREPSAARFVWKPASSPGLSFGLAKISAPLIHLLSAWAELFLCSGYMRASVSWSSLGPVIWWRFWMGVIESP